MTRTVAAYIRVSTVGQDLGSQRAALERAARARGDRITKWFHEKQSARTLERPELVRLRGAARRGELAALYVFRLDRLARSGIRDTLAVVEELRSAGCRLVTIADGFELAGPAADVVVAVMAWAAQMERAAIGERISAARRRVADDGGAWGRPRRYVDVARARELEAKGKSVRQIAAALKVPRSTVARAMAYLTQSAACGSPRAQHAPQCMQNEERGVFGKSSSSSARAAGKLLRAQSSATKPRGLRPA
jgi:DNA invertase Pin-like site-specific DNA recombinase